MGNTYQASLSLRINLKRYIERHHHLLSSSCAGGEYFAGAHGDQQDSKVTLLSSTSRQESLVSVLLFVGNKSQPECQVKPFRFELAADTVGNEFGEVNHWMLEKTIEFKLLLSPTYENDRQQARLQVEELGSVSVDVSWEQTFS